MKESQTYEVKAAILDDVPELGKLFDAYRVFYEAVSMPAKSESFVEGLIAHSRTRFFLARETDEVPGRRPVLGFVHLMPSISTVAMRPVWLLEDLFVVPEARRGGVASALMRHAEGFARESGAERLTLSTAHNNKRAQSLYKRIGYVREEHFWYFHRMLDE